MAEFFHMGGYAFFVWTSYAIVALVLGYLYFAPIGRHRNMKLSLAADLEESPTTTSRGSEGIASE